MTRQWHIFCGKQRQNNKSIGNRKVLYLWVTEANLWIPETRLRRYSSFKDSLALFSQLVLSQKVCPGNRSFIWDMNSKILNGHFQLEIFCDVYNYCIFTIRFSRLPWRFMAPLSTLFFQSLSTLYFHLNYVNPIAMQRKKIPDFLSRGSS